MPHIFLRHFNLPSDLTARLLEDDFLALSGELSSSAAADCRTRPEIYITLICQKDRSIYTPYEFKAKSALSSGFDRVNITVTFAQAGYIAICSLSATREDSWYRLTAPFLSESAKEERFQEILKFLRNLHPSPQQAEHNPQPGAGDSQKDQMQPSKKFYQSSVFWTAVGSIGAIVIGFLGFFF